MPEPAPFVLRHRRGVTVATFAFLAALVALHVLYWHWPHRLAGVLDELPLLGIALAASALAFCALWLLGARRARDAAWPAAAIAGVVAFLAIQAVDPFVARRDWHYAPAACDFAASFPRRPTTVTAPVRLGDAAETSVTRAVHTDVGRAFTQTAECLPVAGGIPEATVSAVAASAEALLRQSAARLRLKIDRVARPDPRTIVLTGTSDEGRTAANDTLVRRAEARAMVGPSSVLVVWASAVAREEAPPPDFAAIFAGIAMRAKP